MRNPLMTPSRTWMPPCRTFRYSESKLRGPSPIAAALPEALVELQPRISAYARSIGMPAAMPEPHQMLYAKLKPACGKFGCVFGTGQPNVLLKLTTDPAEAMFASLARHLPQIKGLLEHYGVLSLDTPRELIGILAECKGPVRKRIYAIWREECESADMDALDNAMRVSPRGSSTWNRDAMKTAEAITGFVYGKETILGEIGTTAAKLKTVYDCAQAVLPTVPEGMESGPEAMARHVMGVMQQQDFYVPPDVRRQPLIAAVAGILEGIRAAATVAMTRGLLREVADALAYLAVQGIILMDIVPPSNCGQRRKNDDYLVLLDTGMALVINPQFQRVWIDGADEPQGLFAES